MTHEIWKEAVKAKRGFAFISFLIRCRVEFMLMAGAAAAYHDLRDSEDDFADLDILINPTEKNSARFAEAMELAAIASGKLVIEKFDKNLLTKHRSRFSPDRENLDVDFVTFLRPNEFATALRRASVTRIAMMPIPIMALEDMLPRSQANLQLRLDQVTDIASDLALLAKARDELGKFYLPPVDSNRLSPESIACIEALLDAQIPLSFFTRTIQFETGITELKLVYPVEISVPPEARVISVLQNVLSRLVRFQSVATAGNFKPGSRFLLSNNDDSLRINIAQSQDFFMGKGGSASEGAFGEHKITFAPMEKIAALLTLELQEVTQKGEKSAREIAHIKSRLDLV
ncbi:MAG: hypothetical protein ABIN69_09885 [Aestuariivirga sp.]